MKNISFYKSVHLISQLPTEQKPEIVLCGRSNVGKSTFINSTFNRKGIAKTSQQPGKTRSINYYDLDDKVYLVDLPGYGYASVPEKEKIKWQKLIEEYFENSKNISLVFHIVDSRIKPTVLDIELNGFLRYLDLPYVVLLNKVDKLNKSETGKSIDRILDTFPELSLDDNLILHSSTKKIGKKEIQKRINSLFL